MDRPDTEQVLSGLRGFQRDTVEYVFRRMYLDENPTRRFLIADEVGLGKTYVARGVIAKAIDHLQAQNPGMRIDIVYICSNAEIARQNIRSLNVTGSDDARLDRITLMPKKVKDLEGRSVNLVSLTPNTSLNMQSGMGNAEERALLYMLLQGVWRLRGEAPINVFHGRKDKALFRSEVDALRKDGSIDTQLRKGFEDAIRRRTELDRANGKRDLHTVFTDLCSRFSRRREYRRRPIEDRSECSRFINKLRMLLAESCIEALEPDIIILDEFQRFKYLLDPDNPESALAQGLFQYSDETTKARVILLSATPYKMYTLSDERESDDHYRDFLQTLRFLQECPQETARFEGLLSEYRLELYSLADGGGQRLTQLKRGIEESLRRVMVRTERLAATQDRDGMLVEMQCQDARLDAKDLRSYLGLQEISRAVGCGDTTEYWKSAPYLLNFMDNYELRRAFDRCVEVASKNDQLAAILAKHEELLLLLEDVRSYHSIDPSNARLRDLVSSVLDNESWRLLWLPASLPYYQPSGPYAEVSPLKLTKRLVFSSWLVVPKVISAMLSYEVERRMHGCLEADPQNTPEARRARRPLLRFSRSAGRLTGMPLFTLIYPCSVLAEKCDPLAVSAGISRNGKLPSKKAVLKAVQRQIEDMLVQIGATDDLPGQVDDSWYWAAPILLDLHASSEGTGVWLDQLGKLDIRVDDESDDADSDGSAWLDHVKLAQRLLTGEIQLGRPPKGLSQVLAEMAIGGPGVVGLRAISRICASADCLADPGVRTAAARIGWCFLHLFNLPEVIALVRGMNPKEPYWRRAIEYCIDGGLQAVMDEYLHLLGESLFGSLAMSDSAATEVASHLHDVLTLRTSAVETTDITVDGNVRTQRARAMRGRFALRFGDSVDDEKTADRGGKVRKAFNSPFWPFVLATTSVGQEGLDFHPYCHAVVHWNLPSNPVDLEQREGRVHRYKGHAVRKNLALVHGGAVRSGNYADPWKGLFECAGEKEAGLVPYWIYPAKNGAKIERHVPMLPLSREQERMHALRRSLAVYRMVFGQSRQEDLVSYLTQRLSEAEISEVAPSLQIDLRPPAASAAAVLGSQSASHQSP